MTEKKEGISQDTKVIIVGNLVTLIFLCGVAWAGLKWQDKTIEDHMNETREEPVRIARLETTVTTLKEDIAAIKTDVKELLRRGR